MIGNGHHHSLRLFCSLCALAHALPSVVDAWFPVPSFAVPALTSSARTLPVPVASWFRIQYRISSSSPDVFALLKMSAKHSPSLGRLLWLHVVLFDQLGFPLGSVCCPLCRSLHGFSCTALLSLLVVCLCLYMQANDSPNLLCASLLLSDVLQQRLLGRAQVWVFINNWSYKSKILFPVPTKCSPINSP